MKKEITGTVVSAAKQWWLKVNTKPVRLHPLDGAAFPHIIKVSYTIEGKEYRCRKWVGAGRRVPNAGDTVKVLYCAEKPSRASIELS